VALSEVVPLKKDTDKRITIKVYAQRRSLKAILLLFIEWYGMFVEWYRMVSTACLTCCTITASKALTCGKMLMRTASL